MGVEHWVYDFLRESFPGYGFVDKITFESCLQNLNRFAVFALSSCLGSICLDEYVFCGSLSLIHATWLAMPYYVRIPCLAAIVPLMP